MITSLNSALNKTSRVAVVKRYVEDGSVLAEGTSTLYVIEDYLTNLGYDLSDPSVQEWREVPSYPNYEVSDLGLIRNKRTKRVLSPTLKSSYIEGDKAVWRTRVGLSVNGKRISVKPHRLVAEAFLGEAPMGKVVSHSNDRPIDNRLSNLSYVTPKVNVYIKHVLKDLRSFYITNSVVDYVYNTVEEVLNDNLDAKVVLPELSYLDVVEVRDYTELSVSTISAIYEYKTKGTGMFNGFGTSVTGRIFLP